MSLTELIQKRRSIRHYKDQKIEESLIHEVISVGLWAPFPSGQCPVRILWLKSPDYLRNLRQIVEEKKDILIEKALQQEGGKKVRNRLNFYWRHCEFLFNAPTVLLIGYQKVSKNGSQDNRSEHLSVGLFLQNMLLRAEELGLASCVLSSPFLFISELPLIKDIEPMVFLTLGYGDEIPQTKEIGSIDEIVQVMK